jgi:signal transduction histidine kinase
MAETVDDREKTAGNAASHDRRPPTGFVAPAPAWRGWRVAGPILLLLACAGLLVGSDVAERRYFPAMATGWRHFFLTIRSGLITGIGCGVVYWVMRQHQRRLALVADELSGKLRKFHAPDGAVGPAAMVSHEETVVPATETLPAALLVHSPQISPSPPSVNGRSAGNGTWQHRDSHHADADADGLRRLGANFDELLLMLETQAGRVRRLHECMLDKEKMAALGQLAAGIAHEIGNPLSSISSIVQMIRRKAAPNMDLRELDLIQTHIQRISTTVRQLTSLSRPAPQRWELVDLGQTLEEAVSLVSFDQRAKGIQLDFQRPCPMPKTWAMPGRLQQVFINVLLNAFDSMPAGGKLTISAAEHGDALRFGFADTGYGIPREIGRRIFEPFFTTKPPGRGTGLGLAVSFGIVQQHKGKIAFAPRAGGGTVFTVDIPIFSHSPDPSHDEDNCIARG